MTLEIFARDYVPLIQASVMTLGLLSIAALWYQIRESRKWNKLNSPSLFIDVERSGRLHSALRREFDRISVSYKEYISDGNVKKILNDPDARSTADALLNDLENLGAAVSMGTIDENAAYAVHSARVARLHKIFKEYINAIREEYEDPEVFIELEKIALRWELVHEKRVQENKKNIEKMQEKIREKQGARKIIGK
ncbi:hypothetical protein OpiT1DRAFT_00780 [Opitutaceae bacterium TAV1]|nr:hypothetical protein OpiT1DRAFT_00780 [Opitutaceae bacterium TAV1]